MSVDTACQHYGINRQSYYKQINALTAEAATANKVIQLVRDQRIKLPQLGTRKLYYLLKPSLAPSHIKLGRDGLFDVLRGANMLVKPKRAYHKTTHSHHRFRKHPNLLKVGDQQVIAKDSEPLRHSVAQVVDIICSMTDGYDCYQNTLVERVDGIRKLCINVGGALLSWTSPPVTGSTIDNPYEVALVCQILIRNCQQTLIKVSTRPNISIKRDMGYRTFPKMVIQEGC
jgi:hypothetical protein